MTWNKHQLRDRDVQLIYSSMRVTGKKYTCQLESFQSSSFYWRIIDRRLSSSENANWSCLTDKVLVSSWIVIHFLRISVATKFIGKIRDRRISSEKNKEQSDRRVPPTFAHSIDDLFGVHRNLFHDLLCFTYLPADLYLIEERCRARSRSHLPPEVHLDA